MLSLEPARSVESPAEDAAEVAELKSGRELYASVTLNTIPSLVAEPAPGQRRSGPPANLNTRMSSY